MSDKTIKVLSLPRRSSFNNKDLPEGVEDEEAHDEHIELQSTTLHSFLSQPNSTPSGQDHTSLESNMDLYSNRSTPPSIEHPELDFSQECSV